MSFFARPTPPESDFDPFDLIRYVANGLLVLGTLAAVVLWALGITSTNALLFFGAVWSLYGLTHALLDEVLDPGLDLLARMIQNVGLDPARRGYSRIEAMAARGELAGAAAAYRERAGAGDAEALVRRAGLLAGALQLPEQARMELEEFRETRPLAPADDVRIGAALADLYERQLDDPGRAMRELRRLLDRYPSARGLRRIRRTLALLKEDRFGRSEASPRDR